MPGILLRHDASRLHDTGAHPERIARIVAVEQELAAAGWLGYEVREAPDVPDVVLHRVHPPAYCAAIEAVCAQGGGALDPDTVVSPGSYDAARRAAGGAVALVDALLGGEARVGASLHRPPGHHAEAAQAMGFCLFNSIAVAARHAVDGHGVERVLVLDWDVHHGNGTNDIFHADPAVLYASIHQSPLYPGTGDAYDTGSGPGTGLTVNMPVPAGSGDALFNGLVEHVVVPLARRWQPGLLLISAGFDAHVDDPLAGCTVTTEGYRAMAATMRALAAELDVPLGIVLEGGYDLGALTASLRATLEAVAAEPEPLEDTGAAAPAGVAAAAQRALELLPPA